MAVRPADFYVESSTEKDWLGKATRAPNIDLLLAIRRQRLADRSDLEVAVPLARVVHDEFQKYGTDSTQQFENEDIREALAALRAVLKRLGVNDFAVPFRDYDSFHDWWKENGAYGSW